MAADCYVFKFLQCSVSRALPEEIYGNIDKEFNSYDCYPTSLPAVENV